MIDESMGKILGMAMAYGVSSLGLLLAYYNYRKRMVKAEKVFTPRAWGVLAGIIAVVGIAVVVIFVLSEPAAKEAGADAYAGEMVEEPEESKMAISGPEPLAKQEEEKLAIGIIIPALIFIFSFWVTWRLYKHFTRRVEKGDLETPGGGGGPPEGS